MEPEKAGQGGVIEFEEFSNDKSQPHGKQAEDDDEHVGEGIVEVGLQLAFEDNADVTHRWEVGKKGSGFRVQVSGWIL